MWPRKVSSLERGPLFGGERECMIFVNLGPCRCVLIRKVSFMRVYTCTCMYMYVNMCCSLQSTPPTFSPFLPFLFPTSMCYTCTCIFHRLSTTLSTHPSPSLPPSLTPSSSLSSPLSHLPSRFLLDHTCNLFTKAAKSQHQKCTTREFQHTNF